MRAKLEAPRLGGLRKQKEGFCASEPALPGCLHPAPQGPHQPDAAGSPGPSMGAALAGPAPQHRPLPPDSCQCPLGQ